ncbi:unnamed protein product [Phytophthora fragariaefolia]|uniref:Unnamed protein product n=1 Tax=Phytophthora fragariaefolia TaxID=1490495 RepID=A0A9W7D4U5_9STRA|nr:unnamed protein product [Phytophthora fragariaefolia]
MDPPGRHGQHRTAGPCLGLGLVADVRITFCHHEALPFCSQHTSLRNWSHRLPFQATNMSPWIGTVSQHQGGVNTRDRAPLSCNAVTQEQPHAVGSAKARQLEQGGV